MGPHDGDDLFGQLKELQQFRKKHPEILISRPADTQSGYWELSLPSRSTAAYDGMELLLMTLRALYPDMLDDPEE